MGQVQWSFYQLLWRYFERVRSNLCEDKIYRVKICHSITIARLQKMKYRKLTRNLYMFLEEGFLKLPHCRPHKINLPAANTKVVLSLSLFSVHLSSVSMSSLYAVYLSVSCLCYLSISCLCDLFDLCLFTTCLFTAACLFALCCVFFLSTVHLLSLLSTYGLKTICMLPLSCLPPVF